MPDRSIMGHTPPVVWRPLFKKLQRGQLDTSVLAQGVIRALAREAKEGRFRDAPAFLRPLQAAVCGEISREQLHDQLRIVEQTAQDADLAADMLRAAESLEGDTVAGNVSPEDLY